MIRFPSSTPGDERRAAARPPRAASGGRLVHSMGAGPTFLRAPEDAAEERMNATINTTPLVDVMLVLLIIFLITIPVVTASIPLELPKESNVPTQTRPDNVVIAIDRDGDIHWGLERVPDIETLVQRLKTVAVNEPQPEVHIRGDLEARYESVGRVVAACLRAGIANVGFITEPPAGGDGG
jgi:biopolymer transport protein ExbD